MTRRVDLWMSKMIAATAARAAASDCTVRTTKSSMLCTRSTIAVDADMRQLLDASGPNGFPQA